jgi:hypothetical protein
MGANMHRRNFLQLVSASALPVSVAGLAGCSAELPAQAVAAWRGPIMGDDVRLWLLGHAILAPHSHNLQSWLVDLRRPHEISLYCDRNRLLPETDPLARQIMLSQGTFLELLDLAARQKGLRAEIELFPEGDFGAGPPDARPTARIWLAPDAGVAADPLFGQILARRTNREAYLPRAPSAADLQAIAQSVAPHPVRTGFAQPSDSTALRQHRAIAAEAWRIELETPRTVMESYRVLRVGPAEIAQHRDGISLNNLMVRTLAAVGLFDRSQPPQPGDYATTSQIDEFNAKLEATPAFFWMTTQGNDRRTQVNAGRAYVRAQLAATARGLSMQPLSQALQEYPEQARPYAQLHALLQAPPPRATVQMWTRLGFAPPVGPSPRRGVQAHILRT